MVSVIAPGLFGIPFGFFSPQSSKGHKGDYHSNFNRDHFTDWWRNHLLPNLSLPSLIFIDNVSYHKTKPKTTPQPHKMRKAEIMNSLKSYGLSVCAKKSWDELKLILRDYFNANIKPEVVTTSEDMGHRVIFTPPHHLELQPIELLWVQVEGNVAAQCSSGTTLSEVRSLLEFEFSSLYSIAGNRGTRSIINHVDDALEKCNNQILEDDNEFGTSVRDVNETESESELDNDLDA